MDVVALVTGGNRGIGLEVCRQLARAGHTVVLTARSEDKAREAAGVLAADGLRVHPIRLDVTDPADSGRLAGELAERFGGLDVLVNNAAITYDTWQRASSPDLGVVREAMDTNLYGAWQVILGVLPLLRASGHPRIVNVSSGLASLTTMGAGSPAYRVSKTALNALTCVLADELRIDGVLVNAICPGWVATDMGGPGGRPVAEGAAGIVWAATLPDGGPTGGFFRDRKPVPW
ncbi:SDR family oxidoreductase [Spongiactinospora sp. TRM90649]|uniref:SDR family oxidoreductase n=1 Tax=Spongiactinospora sp. TRM90649 TaxID=3031114 RepID=UPI0023FA0159|nr:SDR family oxidoreductase [Spongiactinospora sp. TRM90649]MDF5752265.1 SDR family oxidoreductase [Spongiactinospora sp. TRM90649]